MTRTLNVNAEQLELLRVAVNRRLTQVEGFIAHNAAIVRQRNDFPPEEVDAARGRLAHQRAQHRELLAVLELIENT